MTEKRFKQIILHAGLHKTGTSSIQNNCHKYRDWLHEHGIVYPGFKYRDKHFSNHSEPLIGVFGTKAGKYGMPQRLMLEGATDEVSAVFSQQLQQVLENPGGDTLLLSAEMICEFSGNDMAALRRHLEKFTDSLQVMAMIRSPESSVESILQQRCRGGNLVEPESLVGVVTQRFKALQHGFADILQVVNYHEAREHPLGLVGGFFCRLGLPQADVARLEFVSTNVRTSMESYRLMEAINRAYPAGKASDHGVRRHFSDMNALYTLPGQPFQIEGIAQSPLSESLRAEGAALERELKFTFPPVPPRSTPVLWQGETLLALQSAINLLDKPEFREVAKGFLRDEATRLRGSAPDTSAVLEFIAQKVDVSQDPPTELILQKVGADYFKYAALQMEPVSADMALWLMLLAQQLRPQAEFISERVEHYRKKSAATPDIATG
ncbi:MAG: hypothetical protein V2I26_01700 [Halieaceae bacterium]|nr:hypothetical protein [Halieaceae bacterium]